MGSVFLDSRYVLTFLLYVCGVLSLCVFIVLWNDECKDQLTAQFGIQDCTGNSFCVEFLSTYLALCKYSINDTSYLVWILYYVIILSILMTHWIASQVLRHKLLVLSSIFVQIVGINLVWIFDVKNIKGSYQTNAKIYHFEGYLQDDNIELHRVGVVLFLISSLFLNLCILYVLVHKRQKDTYVLYAKSNNNYLKNWIVLEEFADLAYMGTVIAFILCFFFNLVQPAIVLEYIIILCYFILLILNVRVYWLYNHNFLENDETSNFTIDEYDKFEL